MSKTVLTLRESVTLPLEAEAISPDRFHGLSQTQVAALPVLFGRRHKQLGDFFQVDGDGTDEIVIQGNLSHVKRIGQGMTRGKIDIRGDVGMHLGCAMRGGEISVQGDVGAWAGAKMSGGTLWVRGSAGALLGGP
jgi:formylmethanofuran dehydrogenase subunit C